MKFTERSTVFTDDDLKRLKECINKSEGRLYIARTSCEDEFDMPALLARLEASERKNKAYELHHDADNDGDCFIACPSCKEIEDADRAWCESKGL